MGDKESSDPEKKMTKDFLDRWKKIASKYETKEEEAKEPKKETPAEAPGGSPKTADEELDDLLDGLGQRPAAPDREVRPEDQEIDDLLTEFGLEAKEGEEAPRPPPAPPPPARAEPPPARVEPPPARVEPPPARVEPAKTAQRRVLETLKKVGLVGPSPPGGAPAQDQAEEEPEKEPKEPVPPPAEVPAEPVEGREDDSLLLELEALLADEEPTEPEKADEGTKAPGPGALEEEDLLAELEVMLQADEAAEPKAVEGEPAPHPKPIAAPGPAPERPAPEPAVPRPKPEAPEEVPAPPPPVPPRAVRMRVARAPPKQAGRVNAGRVNGGRVKRWRVNGGRVNGGRVNGGRVNGGRVNGGRVNGGRVNGGRVNGGRVNGGRVNGGRVNGGRVNGGRVNGGRVNGGRVNGGRVNGSWVNGVWGYLPATAAQARRARVTQLAIAAAVTVMLFAALVILVPSGGGPQGPQVDGSIADWPGGSTLFYTGATDPSTLPSLDLRGYAIRAEGETGVWFTAEAGDDFFTRQGGATPARGDILLVLVDVDGSAVSGYSYRDLGVDRVVEVVGWGGEIRASASREFTGLRPSYDWGGFESAGALQVAVDGKRVEGLVSGLSGVGDQTRAAFVLRGISPSGAQTTDAPPGAASIGEIAIAATATQVASGILPPGLAQPAEMLTVAFENPTGQTAEVTGLDVTVRYGPQVPSDPATGSVWLDNNANGIVEAAIDARISAAGIRLAPLPTASLLFSGPLTVPAGGHAQVIVAVDSVPGTIPNGTSLTLSIASRADIMTGAKASASLEIRPPAPGKHPGSYVGEPPLAVAVDGIPLEWSAVPGAADPAGDAAARAVDITGAKGNASATSVAFLVTFDDAPLTGAIIPAKLPPTQQLPSGGGSGLPGVTAPNPGSDLLFVMFDADDNASTGFRTGGHGFDYAVRVDGKAGQPLPDGRTLLRWDLLPSPGWTALLQLPSVAFGSQSVELAVAIPPVVLAARNVTATAYATSWDGSRDDLDALLIFGNEFGTRGGFEPARTVDLPLGEQTLWPPSAQIPEFREVVVPVAGAAAIIFVSRRRAARRASL